VRPKTPRHIKIEVIRLWINGLGRDKIAKRAGISVGTVTAIKDEAKMQAEYHDIDLLRQTSIMLREEGLELFLLSFALRVNNLMKEYRINEDQLEIIISDIATYCFKNDLSYEGLIEAGLKAIELAKQFGMKVELMSDYLTQAKTKLERLEAQKQEMFNTLVGAQKELDTILAEIERYGREMPLIEQIQKMNSELQEVRQSEKLCKESLESAEKRWVRESSLASKLYEENQELNHKLVECAEELKKLREEAGPGYRQARERQEMDLD
jgi:hypothetical protein